jgi:hypothetical protein
VIVRGKFHLLWETSRFRLCGRRNDDKDYWSCHRKSYSRSSVASGSLAWARRLASMLLIQLFSGLNCGVPNAAKATSLRVVRSTASANGDVLVLAILLSRFKLRSATEAGRLCVDQEVKEPSPARNGFWDRERWGYEQCRSGPLDPLTQIRTQSELNGMSRVRAPSSRPILLSSTPSICCRPESGLL